MTIAFMKKDKHILADLDEMLFENREKNYGAYRLRKNYPWHLITSLALVTHVFLVGASFPLWSPSLQKMGIYPATFSSFFSPTLTGSSYDQLKHQCAIDETKPQPVEMGVCVLVDPEEDDEQKYPTTTASFSTLNYFKNTNNCQNLEDKKR
ncbi:MAG: hypothetical protein AAGC85_07085 [Bacteroidota bacterium]